VVSGNDRPKLPRVIEEPCRGVVSGRVVVITAERAAEEELVVNEVGLAWLRAFKEKEESL
jgi:hypothetical protein